MGSTSTTHSSTSSTPHTLWQSLSAWGRFCVERHLGEQQTLRFLCRQLQTTTTGLSLRESMASNQVTCVLVCACSDIESQFTSIQNSHNPTTVEASSYSFSIEIETKLDDNDHAAWLIPETRTGQLKLWWVDHIVLLTSFVANPPHECRWATLWITSTHTHSSGNRELLGLSGCTPQLGLLLYIPTHKLDTALCLAWITLV